jgi:hypothetical protein
MIGLSWVLGIVGVLGVGGAIAAFIFVPALAIPILQNLVSWLIRCKPCLYALVLCAACFASWWFGHHQAALECREEALAAELRNKQFDLENEQKAKADAEKRAKEIEDSSNERAKSDAEYIERLKAKPACELDDDDIGGMPNNKSRPRIKIPSFLTK